MGNNQRSQVEMSPDEISAFVASRRTVNLATVGATGQPHLVAMWFGMDPMPLGGSTRRSIE